VLWTDGVLLIGYALAQQIYHAIGDQIDHYILPVVLVIVLISILPILIEMLRERRAKKRGAAAGVSSDEPDAATAIGVVAAASIAGLAESFHEDDDEEPHTPRSQHR
jgi:membrane-associated protein